jgi:membrane protein implicated in regulation of membrane protease activity
VFFLAALVVLLFLPSPWNLIACGVSLILFVFEIGYWQRVVRRYRVRAGAETLVGSRGTVVVPCRPKGQVRVDGTLWEATSAEGADRGDEVTVVGRDRLTLIVERRAPAVGSG